MRQTSPDVPSVEECPFYICQTLVISCTSSRYIPANTQSWSDRLTAHRGSFGIPCSYMQCSYTHSDSAWIEVSRCLSLSPFWLVANYMIFRTSHFFSWSSSSPIHPSKSWLQKYFYQVRLKPNRAEWQALEMICHPVGHSSIADNGWCTATLQL